MKARTLSMFALLGCVAASVSGAPAGKSAAPAPAPAAKITGDYIEARTASVFAGACHYGGEYLSNGRDAVMAWSFASGSFNGVDISGVRVAAAVTSNANLDDAQVAHKSELTVDSSATPEQANAVAALLEAKCGTQLGQVIAIHRAPISFAHTSDGYSVNAAGLATMSVQYMPDNACCTAPSMVWYEPLTPLQGRKVGYTEKASFSGTINAPWERFGENSAFYGAFAF